MIKKYYTGIGSRKTPANILNLFTKISSHLEYKGFILRSGGALGADLAFENGVKNIQNKDIYLPWKLFNNNSSTLYKITNDALLLTSKFHPKFKELSAPIKKLHARNCYQILGPNLNEPSEFVLCWTPEGKMIGGTSQAIRIALHYQIPVFNYG